MSDARRIRAQRLARKRRQRDLESEFVSWFAGPTWTVPVKAYELTLEDMLRFQDAAPWRSM